MSRPRGTSNSNDRGSSYGRRIRKAWLVETYRADRDVVLIWDVENGADPDGPPTWVSDSPSGPGLVRLQELWGRVARWLAACRCYRCGRLLTVETVTIDRVHLGCDGGRYRRENIRPACGGVGGCNEKTGGAVGAARRKAKAS